MKAKAAEWKREEVEDIKRLINDYNVFGVVNIENLPALQLQRLKSNLKGIIFIKMSKKRLIKLALDQSNKENFDKVKQEIKGMPAIIFTMEDPFKLAKLLRKNKSSAPARAGQVAPNDIYVKAGPTPFAPGPIIGELGQLGIKTEVKEGKVSIKEDKLLVGEGKIINPKQADLLSKLKIEPMQIGLNLILTYQNGEILTKEVLEIDEGIYISHLKTGYHEGFNLAVAIGYITEETVTSLIKKAANEADALGKIEKLSDLIRGKVMPEIIDKKDEAEKAEEKPAEKSEEKQPELKHAEKKMESWPEMTERKREKVIKGEKKPTAEELIKEADQIPETEKDKRLKDEIMIREVEDITKKLMWGEDINK